MANDKTNTSQDKVLHGVPNKMNFLNGESAPVINSNIADQSRENTSISEDESSSTSVQDLLRAFVIKEYQDEINKTMKKMSEHPIEEDLKVKEMIQEINNSKALDNQNLEDRRNYERETEEAIDYLNKLKKRNKDEEEIKEMIEAVNKSKALSDRAVQDLKEYEEDTEVSVFKFQRTIERSEVEKQIREMIEAINKSDKFSEQNLEDLKNYDTETREAITAIKKCKEIQEADFKIQNMISSINDSTVIDLRKKKDTKSYNRETELAVKRIWEIEADKELNEKISSIVHEVTQKKCIKDRESINFLIKTDKNTYYFKYNPDYCSKIEEAQNVDKKITNQTPPKKPKRVVEILFAEFEFNCRFPKSPIRPDRKKRSPSVPALNTFIKFEDKVEIPVITRPPRRKQNMLKKLSYSVSDVNAASLEDFQTMSDNKINGFRGFFDDLNLKKSLSQSDVRFTSPEISSLNSHFGKYDPHYLEQRASVGILSEGSPLSKRANLRKKSHTFTKGDNYMKDVRSNITIKKKSKSVTKLLKRTFSLRELPNSENPSCMPNLFKRYKSRKKKSKGKLPTICEENTHPELQRSHTTESFASIFISDYTDDDSNGSYLENCTSSFEPYESMNSLHFPEDNALKRSASHMEVAPPSFEVKLNGQPPKKTPRLKRSRSFTEIGIRDRRLQKFVLNEEDSSASLNPEAIRKAHELLFRSVGGNCIQPVPPKRTRSRLSLNNFSDESLDQSDEKSTTETFSSIFGSVDHSVLLCPKTNELKSSHAELSVFFDDPASLKVDKKLNNKEDNDAITVAKLDKLAIEHKIHNIEIVQELKHHNEILADLTHKIHDFQETRYQHNEEVIRSFYRQYSHDLKTVGIEIDSENESLDPEETLQRLKRLDSKDSSLSLLEHLNESLSPSYHGEEELSVSSLSYSEEDLDLLDLDNSRLHEEHTTKNRVFNFPYVDESKIQISKDFKVDGDAFNRDCEAGTLDIKLQKLAEFYEKDLLDKSRRLSGDYERSFSPYKSNFHFLDWRGTDRSVFDRLTEEYDREITEAIIKLFNEDLSHVPITNEILDHLAEDYSLEIINEALKVSVAQEKIKVIDNLELNLSQTPLQEDYLIEEKETKIESNNLTSFLDTELLEDNSITKIEDLNITDNNNDIINTTDDVLHEEKHPKRVSFDLPDVEIISKSLNETSEMEISVKEIKKVSLDSAVATSSLQQDRESNTDENKSQPSSLSSLASKVWNSNVKISVSEFDVKGITNGNDSFVDCQHYSPVTSTPVKENSKKPNYMKSKRIRPALHHMHLGQNRIAFNSSDCIHDPEFFYNETTKKISPNKKNTLLIQTLHQSNNSVDRNKIFHFPYMRSDTNLDEYTYKDVSGSNTPNDSPLPSPVMAIKELYKAKGRQVIEVQSPASKRKYFISSVASDAAPPSPKIDFELCFKRKFSSVQYNSESDYDSSDSDREGSFALTVETDLSYNCIKENCSYNCRCAEHDDSPTSDQDLIKIIAVHEKKLRSGDESPDIQFRTWSERQSCSEELSTPSPVSIPDWVRDESDSDTDIHFYLPHRKDTPSPGPPHQESKVEEKPKKEDDRTQRDNCVEIYPETLRQRQRNMAPSPSKMDIKNWDSVSGHNNNNGDEGGKSGGKKLLPSVKALRNQFENGKSVPRDVSPCSRDASTTSNLGRTSSNSSTSSLVMSSLEVSSGFGSLTSSQATIETPPPRDPRLEDEPVEPIFRQFQDVDQEFRDLLSKPPSTMSWDPMPLMRKLYYVPETPKLHNQKTNYINIEGYLEKLPSGRKKATFWNAWKRRFFVAKDGVLFYYQNEISEKPNMKLPLMGGKVEIMDPNMVSVDDGEKELRSASMLGIDDGKGHYVVVRCTSRQEAEKWKTALETHTADDFSSQFVHPWPKPTNPSLLRDTLVIDIGSCSIRAGVLASQPTLPQLFFPSIVSTKRETRHQILGTDALSLESRTGSVLSFPVRPSHKISKFSVDLNAVSSLLQKTFSDLRVDPRNYNLQLSVPRVLNPHTQAELLKILFDKFGIKSVNLTHQSILALYAYNATSGIVVDIGERLDVVPVIDGYIVDGGVSRVPYGGYRIMEHLRHFLFQRNLSLTNEIDSYVIRQVLESVCYCAQHYNTEKSRCTSNPESFEKTANLTEFFPDKPEFEAYRNITLDYGRFQATEGLFNPDAWGLDHPGIHKLVHKAIQECSMDIRKEMSRSVFLVGGVSQLPGIGERLTTELDNLTPPAIRPKVHASPYRYHASYLGACVLAESPAFNQSKITKEEWQKQGNSSLRKWAL